MFGVTIDLLMDTQDIAVNKRDDLKHLVWSSYDRINIRRINEFKDFFTMENNVVTWSGSIQSLHLYNCLEFNTLSIRECEEDNDYSDLFYSVEKPDVEYPLALIVSLKINKKVFSLSNLYKNKRIIENISKEIEKVLGEDPFNCYYSLGEEDLVIVSLSNSVDKFLHLIRHLRRLCFKMDNKSVAICEQTNSFMVQNSIKYVDDIVCNQAHASLYITLQTGVNEDEFLKEFKRTTDKRDIQLTRSTMLVGEYDVSIDLSNSSSCCELFNMYSEEKRTNILNANSSFYKKYIRNSKTIWCIDIEDADSLNKKVLDVPIIKTSIHTDEYNRINKEIDELLVELNEKAIYNGDNTQYAFHNVIYFLKEASLTLNSTTNQQWKYIISQLIEIFIKKYKSLTSAIVKCNDYSKYEYYISDLNELMNDMRSSLSNINRSHELFYHIPTNFLHYSGSFNSILLAYYNFINMLLEIAFKKPHHNNTQQPKIVYFVYFGMTSKIQQKTYMLDNLNPNEAKLVSFELPYSALYDIKKYMISLTHEIYHLIAPYDRTKRNNTVEKLWTEYFVKEEFISMVIQYLNITENTDEHKEIVHIINQFFVEKSIINHCQMDSSNKLSMKMLINVIIKQTEVSLNQQMNELFESLYSDFKNYCLNEKKQPILNISASLSEKIKKNNNLLLSVTNDYKINCIRKRNIEVLISNITESICDIFMCQLSFKNEDRPEEQYIKYLLSFFKERKINYNKNDDAQMRIALFIDYKKLDLDSLRLNKSIINELKSIFSKYIKCYNTNCRNIINSILSTDDFNKLIHLTNNSQFIKNVIEKERDLKKYFINRSLERFDDYIMVITNLNTEFKIAKPEENIYNFVEYGNIETEKINKPYMRTKYIKNLDDYLRIIQDISAINKGREIWYRGICNYSYDIIPSLMVKINRMQENTPEIIPYCYQLALMQECYSSTKKYYRAFAKSETPVAARQSLMQHYGVPTNLLDFSTDPIASLFWALNPTSSNDKDNKVTAAVYIFNPYAYMEAIKYIQTNHKCNDFKYLSYIYPIHSHDSLGDEYIIKQTDDRKTKSLIKKFEKENADPVKFNNNKYSRLPIPIVIPQSNDRIRAQSGTFLAYHLFPIKDNSSYSYLSLNNIHKEYIELCEKNGDKPEYSYFLQRILISPHCLEDIRNALDKVFNYSIKSVYPDLENLLNEVPKRTYGYKEMK